MFYYQAMFAAQRLQRDMTLKGPGEWLGGWVDRWMDEYGLVINVQDQD